ncbi:glutaredoxin 2 [Azorhizobium oxalatiphilum]|uniref:Glutaredoxin 2 n=1 Tax=Azorhizobium oxalatiphilum TaxID=980631 RepID=A0A917CI84_9HYPH|nr:glutaredoxin 2 [Azorhizobium oxalatiphilum]GGF89230.1 glutaredoxin 2 [Azorhizobium oxalatiphilum]
MKLYVYDHCPFCTRARLAFGLKKQPFDLAIIMEGDVETPTRLVGKKMVPILQKDDGTSMGESLDIVAYVDGLSGERLFAGKDEAVDAWAKDAWPLLLKLIIPRFTKGDFPELATPEAREAYRLREEKAFGDLEALMAGTPGFIAELGPKLEALASLLEGRTAVSLSDITLWPLLRSLSIVKGVSFPTPVFVYMKRLESEGGVPLLFDQAI